MSEPSRSRSRSRSSPLARQSSCSWSPATAGSAHARLVGSGPRVDAHDVAGVDEERHLDGQTGLEPGWLVATGGGVALEAGVSLLDPQVDVDRQLDVNRLALVA